jgi:hypothetical protein
LAEDDQLRNLRGSFNLLGSEMKAAGKAGLAMAGELLNSNQQLSAYTSALEGNSMILGKFGKVINGLTKFAEESLSEYQTLTGIGATFGKEMSNIKIAAAEMGMSVKDMTDLIMNNSDSLRTFGGTTDLAISRFNRFSKNVLDGEFGTQLRRLGFTASDINETLITYNELAMQDGNMQRMSMQEQTQRARDFAVELDGLAKLTGKQRKELADDMKARRREGDVQAFLMGQSSETQEQFMLATQKIKDTMGPQFEALFQDLMIRGAPITEETRNAFIALGGSADEFEATVASFKSGMQTGEFDNFNSTLTNAQGAFLDNLKTDEARTMAMQSGLSGVADAMANAYQSSYDFANAVDASAEGTASSTATIQKLQEQITAEQARQTAATGGLIDKTVQMQEALREFTVAATTEVLPKLESMAIKGIDMFLDRMPPASEIAKQLTSGINQLFGDGPGSNSLWNLSPGEISTLGDQQIADAAAAGFESQGGLIAEEHDTTRTEILTMQEQARQAQEDLMNANADLSSQQAELASLTEQQSHAIQNGQFERAAELQTKMSEVEASIQESVQASAQAFTEARVAEYKLGGRPIRGFAEGGNIRAGEVGMVGEAGAEFIAGPANVMSARTSMGVMDNLMKTIKALDTNVQTQNEQAQNSISNSTSYTNLEPKFDAMIGLLSQLVNVEVGAERTAQRTFKATRGLQGNMLRGIGA